MEVSFGGGNSRNYGCQSQYFNATDKDSYQFHARSTARLHRDHVMYLISRQVTAVEEGLELLLQKKWKLALKSPPRGIACPKPFAGTSRSIRYKRGVRLAPLRSVYMGTFLRHQDSTVRNDKNHMGWVLGFLHFFNFHHHIHVHKMLTDRKHADGRHSSETKLPKAKQNIPPSTAEHDPLLSEGSISMANNVSSTSKTSGWSRMGSFISRKMSKKWKKKKTSPLASKLQRTISIHYLECNDYVISDEMVSDSETSVIEDNSYDSDSSASNYVTSVQDGLHKPKNQSELCETIGSKDHVGHGSFSELGIQFLENQVVLLEKLSNTKRTWLNLKDSDANDQSSEIQSKDFLDIQNLFNTNKELFLYMLQDPKSAFANQTQGEHASSSEIVLSKCGSFPGASCSGRKTGSLSRFKFEGEGINISANQGRSAQAISPALVSNVNQKNLQDSARISSGFEFSPCSPQEAGNHSDGRTASSRFKDLRQRIKDIVQENKKEHHRISMDGLLHKIPYGHGASENVKEETFGFGDAPVSDKFRRDSQSKYGGDRSVSSNIYGSRTVQRSRSLTESLDSYARLLEFSSFRENPRPTERLNLFQEDAALQDKNNQRKLGRIFSSPESGNYLQARVLLNGNEVVDIDSDVSKLVDSTSHTEMRKEDIAVDTIVSDVLKSRDSIVKIEGRTKADTFLWNTFEAFPDETIYGRTQKPETKNGHVQRQNEMLEDPEYLDGEESSLASLKHDVRIRNSDINDKIFKKSLVIADDEHRQKSDISDYFSAEEGSHSCLHEQKFMNETCNKQIEPSPTSVLDSCFQEKPVSPVKYNTLEGGSELSPKGLHVEGLVSFTSPDGQFDQFNKVEDVGMDTMKAPVLSKGTGLDFHVQVDQKDHVEFNLVKDILKKSGFNNNKLLREWYSPHSEVDHALLPLEQENPNHDLDIARNESDTYPDHQLLFDQINEVLVKIYARSFSYWPRVLHSNARIRPITEGYHVLEEVWEDISWHLNSQAKPDLTLDSVVARDFTQNDGWMNLRWDTECLAKELEALVFDDLVDEAVFQFDEASSKNIAS